VLTREAVHAEGVPTGYTAVYDVLKAMEDAGRVRRGWFVEGLGATQFALPGADDRLRALRTSDAGKPGKPMILAATDPANAWGAALGWPEREGTTRPQRAAGAYVILHEGALLAWISRGETAILTFLPSEPRAREDGYRSIARALAGWVDDGRRRTVLVAEVDGRPVHESGLAEALREASFVPGARGFLKKRSDDRRSAQPDPQVESPLESLVEEPDAGG
jgi:ATP-dependent Lhr-like helicase